MSASDDQRRILDDTLAKAERDCGCGGGPHHDPPEARAVVTVPLHSLRILLRFVRPAAEAEALTDTERAAYDRLAKAAGRF